MSGAEVIDSQPGCPWCGAPFGEGFLCFGEHACGGEVRCWYNAVRWRALPSPELVLYAVAGTLSWHPEIPGWETDGGIEEYRLPQALAERIASAYNAALGGP